MHASLQFDNWNKCSSTVPNGYRAKLKASLKCYTNALWPMDNHIRLYIHSPDLNLTPLAAFLRFLPSAASSAKT